MEFHDSPWQAGPSASLTFHSTSFSEVPGAYKDYTLEKAEGKRVRNKHKNMKKCVQSGRNLESIFR